MREVIGAVVVQAHSTVVHCDGLGGYTVYGTTGRGYRDIELAGFTRLVGDHDVLWVGHAACHVPVLQRNCPGSSKRSNRNMILTCYGRIVHVSYSGTESTL